jgi:hypothetical protein
LHVSEILDRIQTHFGVTVDRESLVSSLAKKVACGDRFLRPEKNTFALRPVAQMAPQGTPPLLFGSDHFTSQGNGSTT